MPSADGSEREGPPIDDSWLLCNWSKLTPKVDSSGVRRMSDGWCSESNNDDCSGTDKWGGGCSL